MIELSEQSILNLCQWLKIRFKDGITLKELTALEKNLKAEIKNNLDADLILLYQHNKQILDNITATKNILKSLKLTEFKSFYLSKDQINAILKHK